MQNNIDQDVIEMENMGQGFDSISTDINRTTRKLAKVMQTPFGRRILMIVGIMVFLFLLISIFKSGKSK
jgi:hypothetical protein